jgi:hypothetical protein
MLSLDVILELLETVDDSIDFRSTGCHAFSIDVVEVDYLILVGGQFAHVGSGCCVTSGLRSVLAHARGGYEDGSVR